MLIDLYCDLNVLVTEAVLHIFGRSTLFGKHGGVGVTKTVVIKLVKPKLCAGDMTDMLHDLSVVKHISDETIDCIWACYTMTGREDKYQWAGPYLYSRQMIVVRSDNDIWKFDDLEGKRIAVQATTKAEDLFLHRIESNLPTVSQVNCFSATEDMFAAIRKNYVDAIAGHEAMLRKFVDVGVECF